ncbi:unnamed protein product, partial [marine sediment metagenome]
FMASSVKEAIGVAKSDGIEVGKTVNDIINSVTVGQKGQKASMLVDIELGRLTEVDVISGGVVKVGEKNGVPTPINKTIVNIIHGIEEVNKCS